MDVKQIRKHVRTASVVVLFALVLVIPASADTSPQAEVYKMLLPIPALPAVVDPLTVDGIPSLSRSMLPQVSGLPSQLAIINTAADVSDAMVSRVESRLNSTLNSANLQLVKSRSLINKARARVGSPLSDIQARNDTGTEYTAYGVASEMSNSIAFSIAYLRGLSKFGAVGTDLTFVILGLAWIAIVNLIDLIIRVSIVLFRILLRLANLVYNAIRLILDIVNTIAQVIDAIPLIT